MQVARIAHPQPQARDIFRYSAIIPVYNSEQIVGQTIDRTIAFFEQQGLDYELILVNDGSSDNSWSVLQQKAQENPHIIAINFLRNYGQHNAVFCGLRHSSGAYAITLDDDLQNPPEEIIHLIDKALEGYDVVFGRFRQKQHAGYRRTGSRLIASVNRRVFHQPPDLVLTNFRIIRRDVVDRMCSYQTAYPYIQGLALMFSSYRANVWVEHQSRPVGKSNYNLFRILALVSRILFNYSAYPLRLVSMIGIAVALVSFLLGIYFLIRGLLGDIRVPGWTALIVMLAFLNGVTIIIVSMLGEYIVRLVKQLSLNQSYDIKEIIKHHD